MKKLKVLLRHIEPSNLKSKKDEIEKLINEIDELLTFDPENTEILSLKGFYYELIDEL